MSFTEHDDCFIWRCDKAGCGHEAVFAPNDFWSCVAELKSRRWEFFRDSEGAWAHHCGKCRRSSASILDMPSNKLRGSG
jgi:hypothetical protein